MQFFPQLLEIYPKQCIWESGLVVRVAFGTKATQVRCLTTTASIHLDIHVSPSTFEYASAKILRYVKTLIYFILFTFHMQHISIPFFSETEEKEKNKLKQTNKEKKILTVEL
jgi:hypothetical protein